MRPAWRVDWTAGALALASTPDPERRRVYRPLWRPRILPGFLNVVAHVANDLKFASTTSGTTTTGAKGGTFTAGNLLVANVCWSYSGVGVPVLNLPAGWTDSGKATVQNTTPNGCQAVGFLPNNPGGAQTWAWTFTANGTTAISWSLQIMEFSGVASATPLDLVTVGAGGSSTTADSGAQSGTTQSGSLLIAAASNQRSVIRTMSMAAASVPTAGWTFSAGTASTNGTVNTVSNLAWQVLGGTQAGPRAVLTLSASGTWECFSLSFKASAGPITGTGAVAMASADAGAGGQTFSGGAAVAEGSALAGSGTQFLISGPAALAGGSAVAGSGGLGFSGSAAVAVASALGGSGGLGFAGTAMVALAPALAGSGTVAASSGITGSGGVALGLGVEGMQDRRYTYQYWWM